MPRPFEEQLLDHLLVDDEAGLPPELARALAADADLRASWERRRAQAQAINGLAPHAAPTDLAGRVVAATQGGHRQDRALEQLTALRRLRVPGALGARVRRVHEQPFSPLHAAPAELDRRVEAELEDLPLGGAKRMTARLQRQTAPGDLERRLGTTARGRRSAGLVTALTVVSVLAVGGWLRFGGGAATDPAAVETAAVETLEVGLGPLDPHRPSELTFDLVELDPTDPVDRRHPVAMTLNAYTGGALEGGR